VFFLLTHFLKALPYIITSNNKKYIKCEILTDSKYFYVSAILHSDYLYYMYFN